MIDSGYSMWGGGLPANHYMHMEAPGANLPNHKIGAGSSREELIEAGRQFESYFISYLLKVMRETVPQGFLESKQSAYFYSMYDQEIGNRAAESGGIGIQRFILDYLDNNVSPAPSQPSSSVR